MFPGFINIHQFADASVNSTDWTNSFKQAFAEAQKRGGGTIYVPAGNYPTRSIEMFSNTTLYVDNGATINFTDDIENYELIDTEFEGLASKAYKPLIHADHAENIAIVGQGTLNGNGQRWWKELKARNLKYVRPYMINFQYCKNIKLEDVTVTMSPSWTVHPLYCDNMLVRGITIKNPADSPNTDGIDPDGTKNLRILDCTIDVGDDCIAIKSGTEDTPNKHASENITITGCTMLHGHGGVVLGSEMSGGVRNITISNCVFYETDRGIRVKTRRRRGGTVEDIVVSNIVMDKVLCPFIFNMYYFCGKDGKMKHVWDKNPYPVDAGTPTLRNVQIDNIIAKNVSAAAGFIYGLAEQHVENVQFINCTVSMDPNGEAAVPAMLDGVDPMQGAGFYVRNASGIVFNNVVMKNVKGEIYDFDDSVEAIIR